MRNADDRRHESTDTYTNRGIPLPGLRHARQRLGLTQRQLASQAGTGQHTICKLESLKRGAYPQTL
jgi:DNA-binding XRE family transcriptional regulator